MLCISSQINLNKNPQCFGDDALGSNHSFHSNDDTVNLNNSISRSQGGFFGLQRQNSLNSNNASVVIPNQSVIGNINQPNGPNIPIEVVQRTSNNGLTNNPLQSSNNVARMFAPIISGAVEPSFLQRFPALAKLLGVFAAVLSFPVILAINSVVTPFLMGAVLFSKVFGSGELAEYIGASTIAKELWGRLASQIAGDQLTCSDWTWLVLSVVPVYGSCIPSVFATENSYDRTLKLLGCSDEDLKIQRDINDCGKLDQNVKRWVGQLLENERAEINAQNWAKWTKDPTQNAWTGPLSAVMQKLYEGAPKDQTTQKIDPGFASRMKYVLKVIQSDPAPFIPYVSTLGLSGLGTCVDRPVLTFLDLELRAQAFQTLTDIKAGTKTLQNMLDLAVGRLVFDETFQKLAVGMQLTASRDPIEATLVAWEKVQEQGSLNIPALPYRLYGTDLSQEQITTVANEVVNLVTQRKKERNVISEFLARDDSPVPWKEAKEACRSSLSNETQMKLAELEKRENALEMPEQAENQTSESYFASHPYQKYLNDLKAIMDERKQLESDIKFDEAQGRWLVALVIPPINQRPEK